MSADLDHRDVIVLGLGGVGSSAAYHAARAGLSVLGIDQFPPAHDRGSSHGQTRIIRQAYFEGPAYVPLLKRAYELWKSLQDQAGQQLYYRTGLVELGPADGIVIPGVLRSAAEHGLAVENLSPDQLHRRWPGLRGNDDWKVVLEQDAGYLMVEDCVAAHLQAAQREGAALHHNEVVHNWQCQGNTVSVQTDRGKFVADRLIIAAGPWSQQVAAAMNLPLQVLRKHQYWLHTHAAEYDRDRDFPCFFFETLAGQYYGFPSIHGSGVKVARHSGGEPIDGPTESHPHSAEDEQLVGDFVARHLPGVSTAEKTQAGCYYTVTPGEHFIVDTLPEHPQVTLVAGLSGHGFKFTGVLGEIAAALAGGQVPPYDLTLFQLPK
jgi:monomeric sarcosine oxidase